MQPSIPGAEIAPHVAGAQLEGSIIPILQVEKLSHERFSIQVKIPELCRLRCACRLSPRGRCSRPPRNTAQWELCTVVDQHGHEGAQGRGVPGRALEGKIWGGGPEGFPEEAVPQLHLSKHLN